VPAGWYDAYVLASGGTTAAPQQMQGEATRVYVMPPEGVLQKTITVNQSVTVNGVTVTLEKIELTTQGMKVYASSDDLPPLTPTLIPPPVTIPTPALPPSTIEGTTLPVTATGIGTGAGPVSSSSAVATIVPPLLPPLANFAMAQYSIDGGAVEQAGFSTASVVNGRLEQLWSGLHPVSNNARQITFTITSLDGRQGSWVFVINLT
jgi:hypothetical protein